LLSLVLIVLVVLLCVNTGIIHALLHRQSIKCNKMKIIASH
jgi:hypothetical protein